MEYPNSLSAMQNKQRSLCAKNDLDRFSAVTMDFPLYRNTNGQTDRQTDRQTERAMYMVDGRRTLDE